MAISRLNQLAGDLYLKLNKGDSLTLNLDFDIDLTGFTFDSKLYNKNKTIDIDLTVTAVNLALGQINVTLTTTDSDTLTEGNYEWYLAGTISSTRRTYLAGCVEVYEGVKDGKCNS
jgi:hypothetical protein